MYKALLLESVAQNQCLTNQLNKPRTKPKENSLATPLSHRRRGGTTTTTVATAAEHVPSPVPLKATTKKGGALPSSNHSFSSHSSIPGSSEGDSDEEDASMLEWCEQRKRPQWTRWAAHIHAVNATSSTIVEDDDCPTPISLPSAPLPPPSLPATRAASAAAQTAKKKVSLPSSAQPMSVEGLLSCSSLASSELSTSTLDDLDARTAQLAQRVSRMRDCL